MLCDRGARTDGPPPRASSLRLYGIDQSADYNAGTENTPQPAEPHVTEGVRPPLRQRAAAAKSVLADCDRKNDTESIL
jgi:hypothetical protein